MFGYPHFNEVDRPELLAHDLADDGWTDSGIKAIYYQFAADEDSLEADWLTYDELDKPAMREEYFGNIYAKDVYKRQLLRGVPRRGLLYAERHFDQCAIRGIRPEIYRG